MQGLFQPVAFLTLFVSVQLDESASTTEKPSALLQALAVYEDPATSSSVRTKRQCGVGGCGGGCRGGNCGYGGGCRGGSCGYGGCRGGNCGGCSNPCGAGGRLCCDNVAPRPCVNCGLSRGIFPEPLPIASVGTCCTCCMPLCLPRCVNFGCGRCGGGGYGGYGGYGGFGFGGYDYFDYFG